MVEVGSLEIAGTINVEGIKLGLNSIKRGLSEAKESAKSAFGDMNRLGGTIKDMAGPLAIIGSAISGAFLGIATMAPQIAPHLARMKADFFRLSTIVGDIFEPVFSHMADLFERFVNWLDSSEGRGVLQIIADIVGALVTSFENLGNAISNLIKDIKLNFDIEIGSGLKWLVENFGAEIVAGIIGWKLGGPAGGATAFGATSIITGFGGEQDITNVVKSVLGGAAIGAAAGSVVPGVGTAVGAAIGGGAAGAVNIARYFTSKELEEERLDEITYKYGGI